MKIISIKTLVNKIIKNYPNGCTIGITGRGSSEKTTLATQSLYELNYIQGCYLWKW